MPLNGLPPPPRLAAAMLLLLPLAGHAEPSAPSLSAEAARATIGRLLNAPAFTGHLFSAGELAAGAAVAFLAALALVMSERAKRRKAAPVWPGPAYSPMTPPTNLTPVIDTAEREWPASPQAALDLLYQGLLARLATDYHLHIPLSATEPEVLARVASLRLGALEDFTRRLIQQRQSAVYAGMPPDDAAWAGLVTTWHRLFPTDVNA